MVHLRQLHETYGDRFEFLFVAIRDAGHPLPEEIAHAVEGQPATDAPEEQRRRVLRAGIEHYHLSIPCLIDTPEGEVEQLYRAWPQRLALVDISGRIVQPARTIESWLRDQPQPAERAGAERNRDTHLN